MRLSASGNGPYYLALSGRTYHRVFPTLRPNHPAHWFLYDAQAALDRAASTNIPLAIVNGVRQDLFSVNRLVSTYRNFAQFSPQSPTAYIELADPGPGEEIAALYRIGDAPVASGRDLYVQCAADVAPSRISILHPLYEPLQYPLLFPHGTLGWGKPGWSQINYYKMQLLCEIRFGIMSRLTCEYICDMYSRVEDERLEFIKIGKQNEALLFANCNHRRCK